jgi:prepilin signal peptidase PulO-like enzyme (type II secretory pathway)
MQIIYLLTFIYGTIIGSGINALDWRTGQDKSWLADRSECLDCGHTLAWWELIPIASFLFLGGTCSECGESISWQYPLVELAAGLLFVLTFQTFGLSLTGVFAAIVWALLLLIYVHDGRTMLVPNWAVWAFNLCAFVSAFWVLPADTFAFSQIIFSTPDWVRVVAGPILAAPFALIWFFSGGKAMGFADAKIALGIGWLLGLSDGLSAIIFAFWIGAAVSLLILAFQRARPALHGQGGLWKSNTPTTKQEDTMSNGALTMQSPVPFGPFLIIGMMLVYFAGITLL